MRRVLHVLLALALLAVAAFGLRSALTANAEPGKAGVGVHVQRGAGIGSVVVDVHRFRVDLRRARFEWVDLGFTTTVGDALGDAALIVNGGYWAWYGSRRAAEGLIMTRNQVLAPLDAKLGGGVVVVRGGKARLEPAHAAIAQTQPDFAVQCSPRLVVAGEVFPGLNDAARAARTALCLRDTGRTLDFVLTDPGARGPTLRELAHWLAAQGCSDALNLDGGPSTAAAWREGGRVARLGTGRELPYAIRIHESED